MLTFTDRLLARTIVEYNTFAKDLDFNLLFTYRVNAGTVFYLGYDDHYRQADQLAGDYDGDGFDDRFVHDHRPAAHEPGHLHQTAVSFQVLEAAGASLATRGASSNVAAHS